MSVQPVDNGRKTSIATQFAPGNKGRPKGSKNRLTVLVNDLRMIAATHGKKRFLECLDRLADEDPAAYVNALIKYFPDVKLSINADGSSGGATYVVNIVEYHANGPMNGNGHRPEIVAEATPVLPGNGAGSPL